ncbi:MAG: carbonic anhydrase [Nitriliruptorales bacterium]|nr:carbonic anhydrase [Nitriliruptorales bacterium]
MSTTEALLDNNRRYAEAFDHGGRPMPPARKVAVLTCMDARLQPERFLGLEIGDAHVIRNAGGRASDDALRSLIISSHLLGTREYLVIHHSDCGMLTFSNDDLRNELAAETADVSDIDFLPFSDLEESVRDDVRLIRQSPFIPADIPVTGYIYDVDTGRLTAVGGAAA